MTDRIDLDELTENSEEETESGNRGDWLWRAGSEATTAPGPPVGGADGPPDDATTDSDGDAAGAADVDADADADTDVGTDTDADAGIDADVTGSEGGGSGRVGGAVPHVPRSNRDRPAGVPESSGGAGAGARSGRESGGDGAGGTGRGSAERDTLGETGPHGGGIDDMTLAFTYRAAKRLADPAAAVADASSWADWIGIVGDVPAHVINKFQRDHVIDADFFNGSGTGPAERLAGIGPHSMFYAERMVLVGVPGADEGVAERADWEFVPLPEAAEGAGWALRDSDSSPDSDPE